MAEGPVIIGMGLATPLGISVAQTAANVRAGLSAAAEIMALDPWLEPVIGCRIPDEVVAVEPAPGVPTRAAQLAAFVRLALAQTPAASFGTLPAFCAWPDDSVAAAAAGVPGIAVVANFTGRAGGLRAVAAACRHLASGAAAHAVVIAADSLLYPLALAKLFAGQRIKTERTADGAIPGEAAAVLLLARTAAMPIARITGLGDGKDAGAPDNDEPCTGDGLTTALQGALGGDGPPVAAWWTTMTGERFFAPEFSAATIRCADRLGVAVIHHPAEALGDTGGAAGLTALILAAADRARPALISASSDDGGRAAILLETP